MERGIEYGLTMFKKAGSGVSDISAAVTSTSGWTDLSANALTFSISTSRGTSSVAPQGSNHMRVFGGQRGGTLQVSFLRNDNGTPDPADFWEDVDDANNGRFQFCIQLDRPSITSGSTVTPAASASNPQYAGTAYVTNIAHWGAGPNSLPVITVTAQIDKDYKRFG